jgi:hypothetical protein
MGEYEYDSSGSDYGKVPGCCDIVMSFQKRLVFIDKLSNSQLLKDYVP